MKKNKKNIVLTVLLILAILLINSALDKIGQDDLPVVGKEGDLIAHFIDVGQGDSSLIELPNGEISLIDGGTRKSGEKVVKYLREQGIKKIDYLIASHPHEDHIGGLPEVIRNFEIGKVYMPDRTANTRIFEELLEEIKKKDLKINIGKAGDTILNMADLKYKFLAPNSNSYSNTNDYSIVSKIEYRDTSIIITGDAERESELDMLQGNYDLGANILRVAHHGSSSSSMVEFIDEVAAEYYIISVGRDNTYGHPHKEVLERLAKTPGEILRTDELGDIIFSLDGEKADLLGHQPPKELGDSGTEDFVGNINTKVVHTKDCSYLPKEENRIYFSSLEEALENGYKIHQACIK